MNSNPGIQTVAARSWNGTASFPHDITKYRHFGWSFEVTAAIAADAVFKVQAAPASAADPCVPGAFVDVEAIAICTDPLPSGTLAEFRIPAGTAVGTICSGTVPCRPDKFVQIVPVSGDTANVLATLLRQGPIS